MTSAFHSKLEIAGLTVSVTKYTHRAGPKGARVTMTRYEASWTLAGPVTPAEAAQGFGTIHGTITAPTIKALRAKDATALS